MPGIILKGTQQRSREIPHPLKAFISVGETRNKYCSSGEQVDLCGVMLEKKQNQVTFLKALWSQVSGEVTHWVSLSLLLDTCPSVESICMLFDIPQRKHIKQMVDINAVWDLVRNSLKHLAFLSATVERTAHWWMVQGWAKAQTASRHQIREDWASFQTLTLTT